MYALKEGICLEIQLLWSFIASQFCLFRLCNVCAWYCLRNSWMKFYGPKNGLPTHLLRLKDRWSFGFFCSYTASIMPSFVKKKNIYWLVVFQVKKTFSTSSTTAANIINAGSGMSGSETYKSLGDVFGINAAVNGLITSTDAANKNISSRCVEFFYCL